MYVPRVLVHVRPRASHLHFLRRTTNFRRFPKFWKIFENYRKSHMPQSRRHGRPRSSRSQHSNPGSARCLSSASVAQMLAAASILKSWMLYSDSPREMMQNAVNESFWDAHGVEIGPRAIFDDFQTFSQLQIFLKIREIFEHRMHWAGCLGMNNTSFQGGSKRGRV